MRSHPRARPARRASVTGSGRRLVVRGPGAPTVSDVVAVAFLVVGWVLGFQLAGDWSEPLVRAGADTGTALLASWLDAPLPTVIGVTATLLVPPGLAFDRRTRLAAVLVPAASLLVAAPADAAVLVAWGGLCALAGCAPARAGAATLLGLASGILAVLWLAPGEAARLAAELGYADTAVLIRLALLTVVAAPSLGVLARWLRDEEADSG